MNDALCTLLFAINEKYDPATKRVEREFAKLRFLPPDFLNRYSRMLVGPFDAEGRSRVVKQYDRMVHEIKELL